MNADVRRLRDRINDYLQAGGLWNPEAMEHDKVRLLLFDIRDGLEALTLPQGAEATSGEDFAVDPVVTEKAERSDAR